MKRWNEAPELAGAIETARMALVRTQLAFGLEEDLASAAKSLGTRLYLAALRYDPDQLRNIEDVYGPDAFVRAFEYLSDHPAGFPTEPIKVPRQKPKDNRKTPPEVRALWRICSSAVGETFAGLLPEVEKKLNLNLSWVTHTALMQRFPRYRGKVEEMRRINAVSPRRISGSFPAVDVGSIAVAALLSAASMLA